MDVTHVMGRVAWLLGTAVQILDANGLNWRIRRNGCLEQVAVKGQQGRSVRRGAFRENRYNVAIPQALGDLVDHPQGIFGRTPFQKYSARLSSHVTHDGPFSQLVLGNEAAVKAGVNGGDVQPGRVIGNQHQWAGGVWLSIDDEFYFQPPKYPVGPKHYLLSALRRSQPGEYCADDENSGKAVDGQTEQLPDT
jgi:hypothetical protein